MLDHPENEIYNKDDYYITGHQDIHSGGNRDVSCSPAISVLQGYRVSEF
jgi:hypothetical protein